MPKAITMTRQLAHAAATDHANRRMRAGGRTAWDVDDYNAAVAEFNRLWPLEAEYPWMTAEQIAEIRAKEQA
jgi:hypothetical protein